MDYFNLRLYCVVIALLEILHLNPSLVVGQSTVQTQSEISILTSRVEVESIDPQTHGDAVSLTSTDPFAAFTLNPIGQREGSFNPDSYVNIPSILHLRQYTSFSIRTCSSGRILFQEGNNRDQLELVLLDDGSLQLNMIRLNVTHNFNLNVTLNDNIWHQIFFRYDLGVLTLGADDVTVQIDNTTIPSGVMDLNLYSSTPSLVVGGGFTGCILQGANIELAHTEATANNVSWGHCPLPQGKSCVGYDTDHCFSEPCGIHGECETLLDTYQCNCYTRFAGLTCDIDLGPLCEWENVTTCENGGLCQEDWRSNSTSCACPTGFAGPQCQYSTANLCNENPCQNNGSCAVSVHEDKIFCYCPIGYTGDRCQEERDNCVSSPCYNGGICIDGVNDFSCNCTGIGYRGQLCEQNIDECMESNPCENGATCFDLYGSYDCACTPGYTGEHCDMPIDECMSNPCQNEGTCYDSYNEYTCDCQPGFSGLNCEINIDDCKEVVCMDFAFCQDGIQEHSCQCNPGFVFTLDESECIEIDECASSPCQNGALCTDIINGYTCNCPPGFTGLNCEENIDDCAGIECSNGATCEDGIETFTCLCTAGYEGLFCQDNLDECAQKVCQNNATCQDLVGDYKCDCQPGWEGRNCDVEINECESSPCLNEGTCQDALNKFICACPPGFSGIRCEVDIDECEALPCQNGGTCQDGVNNFTCLCDEAFMGLTCAEEYDPCASSPCHNGASCIRNENSIREFYCECVLGFEGIYCENNFDDCFQISCPNGQVCFDLINGYDCKCPIGFTGDNCTGNIDDCDPNPCQHEGICHDGIANYTCSCPIGYTGHDCEKDIDECEINNPCVNGICRNEEGSYQCFCRPGFSGNHCNVEFNECLSHPCQNNGECINEINGYTCVCQPGYNGTDCQFDIDECATQPCKNNATCIDGIASFTCNCVPGFTDELCATDINECESNPCANEGMCINLVDAYECNCTDTGFKGDNCEINIDDCQSAPCVNGATCSDRVKDYNCSCFHGYEGKNCELDIQECLLGPCQNGGACLEYSNITLYELQYFSMEFSYERAAGFLCQCEPGYSGDYCEIDIDECASNPCENGECIDLINSFQCSCFPGYEGITCETEINECLLYEPCVNGACIDKIADYQCVCDEIYGGKNCSVELRGCTDVDCLHQGQCVALLRGETDHYFRCDCEAGFTGEYCELATTMSFNGNSYIMVTSNNLQDYNLVMQFRTTLPTGVLAVGSGGTYFTLQLQAGRLNLLSSFLNRMEGITIGEGLNDGDWHSLTLSMNDSIILLSTDDDATQYDTSSHPDNPFSPAFNSTVIGGVTPTLNVFSKNPSFTGCIQDAKINEHMFIPDQAPSEAKVNIAKGCPREEQCQPSPCLNNGICVDKWTSFECQCKRPYIGDTCQLSFTPATFNHEDIRDSLVTLEIPYADHQNYRRNLDISMIVRTRQSTGLIFYIGKTMSIGAEGPYIQTELHEGRVMTQVMLDGEPENFSVLTNRLDDGVPHLLQVKREEQTLQVFIDDKLYLNESLMNNGNLVAEVLYLGGLPQGEPNIRRKRQLGIASTTFSSVTTVVTGNPFKGTMRDIRLSNGSSTPILVQPYPAEFPGIDLPGEMMNASRLNNVLNGTVSDDTCSSNPCENGGTCHITWNDYRCDCPYDFKGKNCNERKYCAIFDCPTGSSCQNLEDGYECISNVTFNGVNTSIQYTASLEGYTESIDNFTAQYRSKTGGMVMWSGTSYGSVKVSLLNGMVVVAQTSLQGTKDTRFFSNLTLDGDWHLLTVLIVEASDVQVYLDEEELSSPDLTSVTVNFTQLVIEGNVHLGCLEAGDGFQGCGGEGFRGCMGEVRMNNILLPYFSNEDLKDNEAKHVFQQNESGSLHASLGCEVCFTSECQNGAFCSDPSEVFECQCQTGYEGDLCETNIDDCINNICVEGSTCVDLINEYKCYCLPGYTGEICDVDINECENNPCQNGGSCEDKIATYECTCTEEYIGLDCSDLKINNCSSNKCVHASQCIDIRSNPNEAADDYKCDCYFGYDGKNCDNKIDFCLRDQIRCEYGSCENIMRDDGWNCRCEPGYEGIFCERDIDECLTVPCANGATCTNLVDDFKCTCADGWEGDTCEIDVNECEIFGNLCEPNGECENLAGSYYCHCNIEYCGQNCQLENPCLEMTEETQCLNEGVCLPQCYEDRPDHTNNTSTICECPEGWKGQYCELKSVAISNLNVIIIVGITLALFFIIAAVGLGVFFMMAKKKRATRGTYSPSRQEFYSPRVEMGNMMKPPPEERLI